MMLQENSYILLSDITKLIELARAPGRPPGPFKIYTSGTGIPDNIWIDFCKDIDWIIVDRDGHEWNRGKRIDDNEYD